MKIIKSLPFKLLVGVVLGILIGLVIPNGGILQVIVTVKYILNQLISFCVPLIIIGFIAPSIVKLGSNASRMLGVALLIAAMSAEGVSTIQNIDQIDRGYRDIDGRLNALGARITRLDECE